MMQEVEELLPDDPYYDGMVTPCILCHEGLVLVLPNYPEKGGETYYNCENPSCELHQAEGPGI